MPTRHKPLTRIALIVSVVLAALAVLGVAYGLYVALMVYLVHSAAYPSCPERDKILSDACGALSTADPHVHCSSSREGPTPSGFAGVCEAYNRVSIDWAPDPDAGWSMQPQLDGVVVELDDSGASRRWACEGKRFGLYAQSTQYDSSDDVRARAAFDRACVAFRASEK